MHAGEMTASLGSEWQRFQRHLLLCALTCIGSRPDWSDERVGEQACQAYIRFISTPSLTSWPFPQRQ